MLKNQWSKAKVLTIAISLLVCVSLLFSGAGAAISVARTEQEEHKEKQKMLADVSNASVAEPAALKKEETVYVLAGADGRVQKILVSDWIQNTDGRENITDTSFLTEAETVKGKATYTMNGDHLRVWDTAGEDVYYQGSIDKELPVALSVSYQLDGKDISAEKLAGQSGRVTIRFDYQNNQFEMVKVDGKDEKIYVPFIMLTGLLLDGETFSNVEVSNGKLINDGSRFAVIGIAFPGLQSNLNLKKDVLELPDYVEITADVKDFHMSNTMTIATNEIFTKMDEEKLDSSEELAKSLGDLKNAMGQLIDGSSALYNGLCTLLTKSNELIAGIDQLADGAAQLKNGAADLKAGAAAVAGGAGELASGLGTLSANNADLQGGAEQVFDSLLHMADTQLMAAGLDVENLTIENYAKVLDGVIASLDLDRVAEQAKEMARAAVTQAVFAQKETIQMAVKAAVEEEVKVKVTDAVQSKIEESVLTAMHITKEEYEAGIASGLISAEQQAQIESAIADQMVSETVQAMIASQIEAQMQASEMQNLIDDKTEEQMAVIIEEKMNSAEVQAQITEALAKAQSGAASISALKGQLAGYHDFYRGLIQYTQGVSAAKTGADALSQGAMQLQDGSASLHEGACALYEGLLTMQGGVPALTEGVEALCDGTMKLSNGLQELNQKGVQKLIDAVEGDLAGLLVRTKATVDVSKRYQSFSGLSDDMVGHVKFIYRTQGIKAE